MNVLDSFLMNNPLQRAFQRWLTGTQWGRAFGVWASRSISLPQLRRMSLETVPWSPLRRPLTEVSDGTRHDQWDSPRQRPAVQRSRTS